MLNTRLIISLAIVLNLGCGFEQSNKYQGLKVKVKCQYMAYACGDCFAKYHIEEVLEGAEEIRNKLVGRDLKITFVVEDLDHRIEKLTAKCAICYDYYFEGSLNYLPKKEYSILEAEACHIRLRDSTCCGE